MQKASLPKGVRDFSPSVLKRRQTIIHAISKVYLKYGFEPLETPAMENLSTLTGKYGDEGDQLLFKILNNGHFLDKVTSAELSEAVENSNKLVPHIAGKGLRYDLTIPFARYVVQNQNDITFPFKRYQIQPVWRADRPQKGRYREFWQCDADVIGTNSMLSESDFIKIYHEAFMEIGLPDYEVRINHRKILEAIANTIGFGGTFTDLTVAIDKLDKIGWEGVGNELKAKGLNQIQLERLQSIMKTNPLTLETLQGLEQDLKPSDQTTKGINDLKEVVGYLGNDSKKYQVVLDLSLARGLDYYTGCIFEAVIKKASIGSVSGGGRYDDLTGVFGMPGISGVGISFGIDRLYDVLTERSVFPEQDVPTSRVLFCHFDEETRTHCVQAADQLRANNIACEVYPDLKNIRKQMDYANKRSYQYTAVVGEQELADNQIQLKNMRTGEQNRLSIDKLIHLLA